VLAGTPEHFIYKNIPIYASYRDIEHKKTLFQQMELPEQGFLKGLILV